MEPTDTIFGDGNKPRDIKGDFQLQAYHDVAQFVDFLVGVNMQPGIAETMKDVPVEITKGRGIAEIALDDAMDAFAVVMKDVPDDQIPEGFYVQLARAKNIDEQTAKSKLAEDLATQRGTSILIMDRPLPLFLELAVENLPPQYVQAFANHWVTILSDFSHLAFDDVALMAENTASAKLLMTQDELNNRLQERAMADQQFAEATGGGVPANSSAREMQMLLKEFGEDLTAKARQGGLEEAIARDKEVKRVMGALIQDDKPHALCIGPEGAGKSTVAEGLAQRIAEGDVPEELKDATLVSLNLKAMEITSGQVQKENPQTGEVAIIKQFQDRLCTVLEGIADHNARGGPQIILNIQDLDSVANPSVMGSDAADVLTMIMESRDTLRFVGEMDSAQYTNAKSKAGDFLGLCTEVKVEPLDHETTFALLRAKADSRDIEIGDRELDKIIDLTDRYMPTVKQPAVSLNILGAAVAAAAVEGETSLSLERVAQVIGDKTGVSAELIGDTFSERINTLGEALPNMVIGQPAVNEIVESLEIANAGMDSPDKPLASYLLLGPTGVGKTETGVALGKHLGIPMIRIDMSNFQQEHAIAKLIGSPPGYVGYNDSPALMEVTDNPYSVLMLDEIEKAHPDVLKIFLSALDKGEVQLMNGQTVDFRNCIILMSSNLGAAEAEQARSSGQFGVAGGGGSADEEGKRQEADAARATTGAAEDALPPEFINRLDAVLTYNSLSDEVVARIAVNKIEDVSASLRKKNQNLKLELSDEAMVQLASLGFDRRYGARPMDRAVKKYIKTPLSKWMNKHEGDVMSLTTLFVKKIGEDKDGERVFEMDVITEGAVNKPVAEDAEMPLPAIEADQPPAPPMP